MLALRAARLLPSLHCKYHHVLPRRALFGGQKEEPVSIYSKWAQHFPDDILLVEMGKFFELRDEAARRAASKLPLQVSSGAGLVGFPSSRLEVWLPRFYEAFGSVAIVVQAGHEALLQSDDDSDASSDDDEPIRLMAKPESKSDTLTRKVARVITPATEYPDIERPGGDLRRLVALRASPDGRSVAVGWYENTTGHASSQLVDYEDMASFLAGLDAVEVIFPHGQSDVVRRIGSPVAGSRTYAELKVPHSWNLTDVFGSIVPESWCQQPVSDSGIDAPSSSLEKEVLNAMLQYLKFNYGGELPFLTQRTSELSMANKLEIDAPSRGALELTSSRSNRKRGQLLSVLDRTTTPMGRRLLAMRLNAPSCNVAEIEDRLDMVEAFKGLPDLRNRIKGALKGCKDPRLNMSTPTSKKTFDALHALAVLMLASQKIEAHLDAALVSGNCQTGNCTRALQAMQRDMCAIFATHRQRVLEALLDAKGHVLTADQCPPPGTCPNVDQARQHLERCMKTLHEHTANLGLKVGRAMGSAKFSFALHEAHGHYYLVRASGTRVSAERIRQAHKSLVHKKVGSKSCYEEPDFVLYAREAEHAQRAYRATQASYLHGVLEPLLQDRSRVADDLDVMAAIDVACSLADVADEHEYVRPRLYEDTRFVVKNGRHPVVEANGSGLAEMKSFVPNDCDMRDGHSWIITGPNMGGKSTFLRQNALMAVMAQMGSFVPADFMELGVVDQIFTRIGAHDDLADGKSTFFVEMDELARILNHATERSFVIIDEVGRGTSPDEGMALAASITQYLTEKIKCRTLSATHFHQLAEMCEHLPGARAYQFLCSFDEEHGLDLQQKIAPGRAEKSFGVEIAQFCGHPPEVIEKARHLLAAAAEAASAAAAEESDRDSGRRSTIHSSS